MAQSSRTLTGDNRLSILCIEDDPDIRYIIDLSLQAASNVRTTFAATADDAMSVLEQGDQQPDCILLDKRLSEERGSNLLARIRSASQHVATPIIFLSAMASSASADASEALGVAGTIAKPFDPLTLAQQILQLLM